MATNKIKFFVSLLLGAALVPAFAFANVAVSADANASAKVNLGLNFCTNLPSLTATMNTRLTNAQNDLAQKQSQRLANVASRQQTRAEDLTTLRAADDAQRQAIYAKLMAEATTTVEQQAVAQFQTTIEAGVTVRKSAVDAAIAAYWASLNDVLKNRQAAVVVAEQNFDASTKSALSDAQSQCADGTAPATVRARFASAAEAAKTKFNSDRKAIDKAGPQIKALLQIRNQAVKNAIDTFHELAENARVALKASFSASASTTTTP